MVLILLVLLFFTSIFVLPFEEKTCKWDGQQRTRGKRLFSLFIFPSVHVVNLPQNTSIFYCTGIHACHFQRSVSTQNPTEYFQSFFSPLENMWKDKMFLAEDLFIRSKFIYQGGFLWIDSIRPLGQALRFCGIWIHFLLGLCVCLDFVFKKS